MTGQALEIEEVGVTLRFRNASDELVPGRRLAARSGLFEVRRGGMPRVQDGGLHLR